MPASFVISGGELGFIAGALAHHLGASQNCAPINLQFVTIQTSISHSASGHPKIYAMNQSW
jgi:hypothetical protein